MKIAWSKALVLASSFISSSTDPGVASCAIAPNARNPTPAHSDKKFFKLVLNFASPQKTYQSIVTPPASMWLRSTPNMSARSSTLPTSRTGHCASATALIARGVILPIVLAVAGIAPRWSICTAAAVATSAYCRRRPDQCKPHENRSGLPLLGNHLLTFQHAHPATVYLRHELELKCWILRFQCRLAKRGFAYGRRLVVEFNRRRCAARQDERHRHDAETSS